MGGVSEQVERVPLIDFSDFAGSAAGRRRQASALRAACEEIGFFYLIGHGIEPALLEAAWRQSQAFFALPSERKLALAVTRERYRGYIPMAAFSPNEGGGPPDLYEGYKIHLDLAADDPLVRDGVPLYGANVWPEGRPAFRRAMAAYWVALTGLSEALLRAFALALELEEAAFMAAFEKPLSNISLLHYPPRTPTSEPAQMGIHPHRDSDAFTILLADPVGGLEVQRRDGRWIAAPTLPGAFVVNIGNMMESWTGGRFVSTPHRVINRSGRERYAIGYFAIPSYDTVIRPLLAAPKGAAREIHVGPFMEALYASNWA